MKLLDWIGTIVRTFVLAALLPGSVAHAAWPTAEASQDLQAVEAREEDDRHEGATPKRGGSGADAVRDHALHDYLVHWRATRRH